jgi:uncharacterized hydrophobic protein (TIGR00271 family)
VRQIFVSVPRGRGHDVMQIANSHKGSNLMRFESLRADGAADSVIISVSNHKLELLIADLQKIPELRMTLPPQGVITLQPPADEAPEQATDVGHRSPIEVYLGGLQSIGSWRGFLSYAAAAGAVVWVGLFTNTIYLLVAAMLIAPFAGPAMTLALGTARGDIALVRQSILRYFSALSVTITVAALFSWLFRQDVATATMVAVSEISSATVLLPLAAGAAGALNLIQSERSSLVSGAAVGVLVAASLAPPAGIIGMGAAIGQWDIVKSGAFLLMLQLAGINLAGSLVFRMHGLTSQGVRYDRGRNDVFAITLAASALLLAGLLWLQFANPPELQRATRSQRAAAEIQTIVNGSGLAQPVEIDVRFTRADIADQNTMLVVAYVQRTSAQPPDQIRTRLVADIQRQLRSNFNVTPLVSLTVLEPPGE